MTFLDFRSLSVLIPLFVGVGSSVYGGETAGVPAPPVTTFSNSDWISMNPGVPGVNGKVTQLHTDGTNIYVAGEFTVAGNIPALNIARWDGGAWHPLGAGIGGAIKSMVVTGGQVFVGGNFNNAGGVPAKCIARWDGTAWHALGEGIIGSVNCLEAFDGLIYAGGVFNKAGGLDAPDLAIWDGSTWSTPSPPADDSVFGLLRVGSDLYASGYFSSIGGVSAKGIARWNGSSWSSLSPSYQLSGGVGGMFWDGTGLHLLGTFEITSGGQTFSGAARWDGVSWSGVPHLQSLSGLSGFTMHEGKLHVGRQFSQPGEERVLKWNGTAWSGVGGGVDGGVISLLSAGNQLFAAGQISHAGGVPAEGVASYVGGKWSPLGEGMDGRISEVIPKGNDLYVRGSFTRIGGIAAAGVAKWSGGSWTALGNGPGGAVSDMVFFGEDLVACGTFGDEATGPVHRIARWDGNKWLPFENGVQVSEASILAAGGGRLYVAGELRTAIGSSSSPLAEWNGTRWTVFANKPGGLVDSMTVADNQLYAAWSSFVGTGGSIGRWDGNSWTTIANGLDGKVRAIAAVGADVYAGGQFTTISGVPADRIARWNGSTWTGMDTSFLAMPPPFISSLLVHGGSVFIGGDFLALNGTAGTGFIAEWDGSDWLPLGTGMDGPVEGLAASDSGELHVAGSFTKAGNTISPKIARATNLLAVPPFSVGDGLTVLRDGDGSALGFGTNTVGQPVTRNFVITNLTNDFFTLKDGYRDGLHAPDFTVSPLAGTTVPAGGSVNFSITFTPSASGVRNASLHLAEAASGGVPFDLTLTGTGEPVPPKFPEIDIQHPVGKSLRDGQSKITYAKTKVLKKGETRTFSIRNTGDAGLSGISVTVGGSHKNDFVITQKPRNALAPGATTQLKIRFLPKKAGKRIAVVRIKSNDANENPFDIDLSGTGQKVKK